MFQQQKLSHEVHQTIIQTRHPYAVNKILLDAVIKGGDSAYECFVEALRKLKQNHLYLLLTVPGKQWNIYL